MTHPPLEHMPHVETVIDSIDQDDWDASWILAVDEWDAYHNNEAVNTLRICVRCQKQIYRVPGMRKDTPPQVAAFHSAGVDLFTPGYGSRHDMSKLIVAICDDCIDACLKNGVIESEADHA